MFHISQIIQCAHSNGYIQVVLQSVFIIRNFNDQELRGNSSIELVATSLAASLFSIANKYTWLDKEGMDDDVIDPEWNSDCPCVNGWYVLRVIWRFSFVATRFCVLSLIWSVLGGTVLGIFLPISFCIWCVPFFVVAPDDAFDPKDPTDCCFYCIIAAGFGLVSLIATPATEHMLLVCLHGWEMIASLTVITIFAYNDFDCGICANAEERQAENNPYIKLFIIAGWSTMAIDFIGYGILLSAGAFENDAFTGLSNKDFRTLNSTVSMFCSTKQNNFIVLQHSFVLFVLIRNKKLSTNTKMEIDSFDGENQN